MAYSATQILDRIERHALPAPERRCSLTKVIPQIGFDNMRTRTAEMLLASGMLAMGVTFMAPGESTSLPHWQVLRQWIAVFPGNELLFGAMIFAVGLLRWAALLINGYYRRTPPIRIAGCMVGSLYWATLTIVLVEAPLQPLPAIIGLIVVCLAFETFCAMRAAVDAYHMHSFDREGITTGPYRVRDH